MATLQKFKLLATQCGVAPSPTRSPRTSPLVQLRRQKTTLRMLLSRSSRKKEESLRNQEPIVADLSEKKRNSSLKDLFVTASPPFEGGEEKIVRGKSEVIAMKLNGLGGGPGSPRPGWVGFRHRMLLRRAWRPMLVTIPE